MVSGHEATIFRLKPINNRNLVLRVVVDIHPRAPQVQSHGLQRVAIDANVRELGIGCGVDDTYK